MNLLVFYGCYFGVSRLYQRKPGVGALAELYTCARDVYDVFRKLHRFVALRVVVDQNIPWP